MLSFNEILEKVEHEISQLSFEYPPKSLYDPIEYILSLGGKRIRPALALMACNLYKENIDNVINPALGVEVFHNFTLLHDDLMDKADKRRNKPTVHKVWNDNTAILSGDAMLIAAYQLIGKTEPDYLKEVFDLFTETALEICGGQQYDMEFESRRDVTEEEYIEMIRLKTSVLLAASLKIGAILADAPETDMQELYNFGIQIGLAFQLQDDYLDVYGDTSVFGKNLGGDILCNKKTYMLINALQRADAEQRKELEYWITCSEYIPSEKVNTVTALYDAIGIKELCNKKIEDYFQRGMSCLDRLQVPEGRKAVLRSFVEALMHRNM